MSAHVIQYDGTFDGLLSAVFYVYAHKLSHQDVQLAPMDAEVPWFAQRVVVNTDDEHAARVFARLQKSLSRRDIITLLYGFLSRDPAMPDTFLYLVARIVGEKYNPLLDYGDAQVVRWMQWAKSVGREKHHMEAFVRFEALASDLYMARIAPRYDILPLIAPHFCRRYAAQSFAIYDTRRAYGILRQDNALHTLHDLDEKSIAAQYHPDERFYQTLWRQYFQSVSIASRANPRLQRQHMPRRYWPYLTEMQPPK